MTSKFNNYFANVVKNLIKVIGESNNKFQEHKEIQMNTVFY